MNKLFLLLFFALFPHICFGENPHWVNENGEEVSDEQVGEFIENNMADALKQQAKEMKPIYESLKECLPIESRYFHIIGVEDSLCHFKYVDYDCLVPLNIAEEYAELGLKSIKDMFNGNVNTKSPESIRIKEILSNEDYCSYKMTWSVTMEDENGNEIPVEGITIE